MFRKKAGILLFTVALGMFCNNDLCSVYSAENVQSTKYPDYAKEYNGEDKYENFNRKMFNFNIKANKYVLKPINILWASVVPKYAMDRLKNCYTNLEYPKKVVSSLLQKDFKSSGKETARFLINSTIGLGGMYDPAKSKFKIEPVNKDMEQALSCCKAKKGPYLVLPFLAPSDTRGYAGKILDCGLNPSTYFFGVGPLIAKSGCMVNKSSYSQEMIKNLEDAFVDPYDVAKKFYGIEHYIKNTNLENKEVSAKIIDALNLPKEVSDPKNPLKSDMTLKNYNPQSPVVDSIRTSLFEIPNPKKQFWDELSVWNRSFNKKIKTSDVNIASNRENYKFRYILQKNKKAPIAIVYPSIGEGSFSHHPVVFAKILHDSGYSVVIQGSTFHWGFIKSAPKDYRPGLPYRDAQYARLATSKILKKLKDKEQIDPCGKIMVGTSYGGLTTLFVAAQEEEENTLGVSKYISISPPIDMFYATRKLDLHSDECNQCGTELQEKTAVTAGKIIQICKDVKKDPSSRDFDGLPLSEEEGIIATNFMMRQKLSDVIFTLEGVPKNKKTEIYKQISNMSFSDYLSKYLAVNTNIPADDINYEMSLYSIGKFLSRSNKYKIYSAKDDYFINERQLSWLKKIGTNKVVLLQNGSHLGFLYREEFQDALKNDIVLFGSDSVQTAKKSKATSL